MGYKVVYSPRYGGYGLSDEGTEALFKLKGITFFKSPTGVFGTSVYFDTELPEFMVQPEGSIYDRTKEYHKWYEEHVIRYEADRHDPDLVAVVEELGSEKASADCARLEICEVKGIQYKIDEYDGYESVIEPKDMNWVVIK